MTEITKEERLYNRQMLDLLRDIALNTESGGGKTAETLGRGGKTGYTGAGRNLFELKQGSKELKASVKQWMVSADEYKKKVKETTDQNDELNRVLDKLIKNITNADKNNPFEALTSDITKSSLAELSAAGITSATTMAGVSEELDLLRKASGNVDLDNMAKTVDDVADRLLQFGDKDVNALAKEFKKATKGLRALGDIGDPKAVQKEFMKQLGNSTKSLYKKQGQYFKDEMAKKMAKTAENQRVIETKLFEYKKKAAKNLFATMGKSFALAIGTVAGKLFGAAPGTGAIAAYPEAGFDVGSVGTMLAVEKAAIALSASHGDVIEFIGKHRNMLSGLTKDATITAERAAAAAETLGDEMVRTFGAGDQLGRLSKMFNILTNLGIPIESGFNELRDSIEIITRNANASATDVFAAFESLAEDKSFRRLFAMGQDQQNMVDGLAQNFLNLQAASQLTIEEFIDLNKRIAEQSKEQVPQRFVQAAFAGRLAERVGMSPEDIALIQRGIQAPLALGKDYDKFIVAMGALQKATGVAMADAQKDAMAGRPSYREFELQILESKIPFKGVIEGAVRETSNPLLGMFVEDRKKAAKANTELIVQMTEWWQEVSTGLAKSIFAPALAIGGSALGGAVQIGGGIALGSAIINAGGGMAGTFKVITGVLGKLAIPVTIVIGAFNGLERALEFNGDAIEKIGVGIIGFADSILGVIPMILNWAEELIGIDIIPDDWDNPFTVISEGVGSFIKDMHNDIPREGMFEALLGRNKDVSDIRELTEFKQLMQMYEPDVRTKNIEQKQAGLRSIEERWIAAREAVLEKEAADRTELDKENLVKAEEQLKVTRDMLAELKIKYEPREKLLNPKSNDAKPSDKPK